LSKASEWFIEVVGALTRKTHERIGARGPVRRLADALKSVREAKKYERRVNELEHDLET
jgi:hypothetical protein